MTQPETVCLGCGDLTDLVRAETGPVGVRGDHHGSLHVSYAAQLLERRVISADINDLVAESGLV